MLVNQLKKHMEEIRVGCRRGLKDEIYAGIKKVENLYLAFTGLENYAFEEKKKEQEKRGVKNEHNKENQNSNIRS